MITTTSGDPAVCARIAARLAQNVGPQRYRMWFERTARLDLADDEASLLVSVPNRFVADWISRHFHDHLRQAARAELNREVTLAVRIDPDGFAPVDLAPPTPGGTTTAPPPQPPPRATRNDQRSHGSLRYRLDDFVVGPGNELAFAAAQRLAQADEAPASGPLFVHGGVGLGKTHLLQGICGHLRELKPQARVLYTTGEQFTNEFLAAVRSGSVEPFRRRIRRLDLLAVDDVHFIANKAATQQEFLHSFNAIELAGARVALASDCHPKLIHDFSQALVSRCVRGLVVEVKPPDTATRMRIVQALAARRGLSLLESVTAVIAGQCTGSVREIEGTLAKLQALASLSPRGEGPAGNTQATIGHALVNQLLSLDAVDRPRKPVALADILAAVCARLALDRSRLLAGQRLRLPVLGRALVIHLARRMTDMSYPELAAALNMGSHSTAIAADQRIARQIEQRQSLVLPNPDSGAIEQVALADLLEQLRRSARS